MTASSKKQKKKRNRRAFVRTKRVTLKKTPQGHGSSSLPPKTAFLGFAIRFAFFFGFPYALLHVLPLGFLLDLIAAVESAALNSLRVASVVFGPTLSSNAAWFQIVPDCSGLVMVSLLFGLLWSTPVSKAVRERFFGFWAPVLLAYNLVRLLVVLYVGGTVGMAAMDAVHMGLWLVDAGLVLGIWWKAFSVDPVSV